MDEFSPKPAASEQTFPCHIVPCRVAIEKESLMFRGGSLCEDWGCGKEGKRLSGRSGLVVPRLPCDVLSLAATADPHSAGSGSRQQVTTRSMLPEVLQVTGRVRD